jgi:hypothetical protein
MNTDSRISRFQMGSVYRFLITASTLLDKCSYRPVTELLKRRRERRFIITMLINFQNHHSISKTSLAPKWCGGLVGQKKTHKAKDFSSQQQRKTVLPD